MNTRAPELSALISIFGSAGPVISTRRSSRSGGAGATVQAASRTSRVADREVGPDARIELDLALLAAAEQVQPGRTEAALEVGHERERVVGQDPVGARDVAAPELDARWQAGRCRACQPSPRRTVASIRPCGSVVGV